MNRDKSFRKEFTVRLRDCVFHYRSRGGRYEDICDYLGCSKAALSGWINGGHEPSIDMIVGLADFLDVSIDWLFGREDWCNVRFDK